ncbi:MAG TPA: hypothetical protein VFU38_10355, partial [Candidatus Krumholzibacteria bacterium]|nr:hypothetical protein [Candidatus Krumholzibacteria bacterium]
RANIDVVLDSKRVLDLFLGPWSEQERERIAHDTVFDGSRHGVAGWIGFRLSPPRAFGTGAAGSYAPRVQPDGR